MSVIDQLGPVIKSGKMQARLEWFRSTRRYIDPLRSFEISERVCLSLPDRSQTDRTL